MKLLLDFNLAARLVDFIADLFPESVHLHTLGFAGEVPDEVIWRYARENGFAILTCDRDFLELANRFGQPPKIIRLDNMNYRSRVAAELIRSHAILISEFANNDRPVLVLRAKEKL